MPRHTTIFVFALAAAIAGYGQTTEPKTAEQVYKNIVQLKGTPAEDLTASMQFISVSLGVECSFCHVAGKPEADDLGPKKSARQMIAMTLALDKDSFRGRPSVTCYSCHRGSTRPVGTPPVLDSDMPARPSTPAAAAPATPGNTVTAEAILEKYVAAVGGADAVKAATSRVMSGKILAGGGETPIDVITKAPNKRVSISHMSGGDSYTAFDGTGGWLGNTGRPARDMTAAEAWSSSLDSEFALPVRIKEIFPQLRRGRPTPINGQDCEVLNASAPGKAPVQLYFDQKTGLLVRMVKNSETAMGRMPVQIDYADYRDAGGVKIPYRWTLARPNGRFTIQIADVKTNVPVEDSKFAKPAEAVK